MLLQYFLLSTPSPFNSFQDATRQYRVGAAHDDCFQFLLGCYAATAHGSQLQVTSFNSFQDATTDKKYYIEKHRENFQFLLGCYRPGAASRRQGWSTFNSFQDATGLYRGIWEALAALSIPFRMLLPDSKVVVTDDTIFQFLLGCYSWTPARSSALWWALSIPFRMLLAEEAGWGLTLDPFQFLLGCYAVPQAPPRPPRGWLSIPFRMLPSRQLSCFPREPRAFNSFQDATIPP